MFEGIKEYLHPHQPEQPGLPLTPEQQQAIKAYVESHLGTHEHAAAAKRFTELFPDPEDQHRAIAKYRGFSQ